MTFPRTACSLIAVLLAFCATLARAELAASYAAGTTTPDSVTAEGGAWTLNNAGAINGTTVISAAQAPDGATGLNAWRMLDNSTAGSAFSFWSKSLTTTQLSTAATFGWRLSANVRVVDPVAANGGTASTLLLYGDNAGKRWILFFDIDASGNLTTNLFGSTTVTVATGATATAYHLHEMVYDPATASVEYFVDSVSKATGYAGTTGTYNGVQWGNGSTAGRATAIGTPSRSPSTIRQRLRSSPHIRNHRRRHRARMSRSPPPSQTRRASSGIRARRPCRVRPPRR